MSENKLFKCEICGEEYDKRIILSKHILFTHKLNMEQHTVQVKYNNIYPLCLCGCGTQMKYSSCIHDFPKYVRNHLHILCKEKSFEEIWGDPKSEKRIKAISEGRKKKFQSGEFNHLLEKFKQPLSEETKTKISKANKGKIHIVPEGFGIGRTHSEETRKKMSETALKKWDDGNIGEKKHYTSKLEKTFANILELMGIEYERFFYVKEIKAFYDFYLPKYNTIIEVDGDFWHCNPDKFPIPKYITQQTNLERDKIKNQWATDNGYNIIRFWENDINNNINFIKESLNNITQ